MLKQTERTTLVHGLTQYCVDAINIGEALNKQVGDYGADELSKVLPDCVVGITVLTQCNTGNCWPWHSYRCH